MKPLQSSMLRSYITRDENKTDFNTNVFPKLDALFDTLENQDTKFKILSLPANGSYNVVISYLTGEDLYVILCAITDIHFTSVIISPQTNTILIGQEPGISKINFI